MAQQPDQLDITAGLCFKLSTRTHPIQISVEVEFKHIGGIVAGSSRLFSPYPGKPSGDKINTIHKSFYQANRIIGSDIVINRFWEKH